ncbi:meiosis initiator protein [Macrotis lagotis]|uniref:meiosis initiator protein n=1 Tax=Macrotis lagotis TaxID=92651 RepID=UPI003D6836B7
MKGIGGRGEAEPRCEVGGGQKPAPHEGGASEEERESTWGRESPEAGGGERGGAGPASGQSGQRLRSAGSARSSRPAAGGGGGAEAARRRVIGQPGGRAEAPRGGNERTKAATLAARHALGSGARGGPTPQGRVRVRGAAFPAPLPLPRPCPVRPGVSRPLPGSDLGEGRCWREARASPQLGRRGAPQEGTGARECRLAHPLPSLLRMWGPSGHPYSPEQPQGGPGCRIGPLCPSERKRRQNYTNTLQELALLLPVPLQASNKKLTKKEILLHVLHYIGHLQRSIDVTRSLLLFKLTGKEEGRVGAKDLHPHLTVVRGPFQPVEESTPNRGQEGDIGGTTLLRRHLAPYQHLKSWLPSSHDGAELTLLEMAEGTVHLCLATCGGGPGAQEEDPYPFFEAQMTIGGGEWLPPHPPREPLLRQELVFYDSCEEEEEEEAVDTGPWLSVWPPEGNSGGSPLVGSSRTRSWLEVGQSSKELGLSPSLFTSPGRLLPGNILQEGTESLTQALFEDVCLSPQSSFPTSLPEALQKKPQDLDPSAPGGSLHSLNLFQSAFSLDHCYLSLSETSKIDSSPSSRVTELVSLWNRRQEASQSTPDGFLSSSDEDGDCTWTPTKRASPLPTSGRKRRRSRAGGGGNSGSSLGRHKESKKAHCPFQLKKKCVNGFIMFCRLNRKQYIRACPGTASTAATKELAHLWRAMTKQERRPYCIKARKFSRQHNRIVRQDCSSEEDDRLSPKPFHLLLAEKALSSPGLMCPSFPLGSPLPDRPESL